MSVHHAISAHSASQAEYIVLYRKLDVMREVRIERAIEQYQAGEAVDLASINEVTQQINQLAQRHHLPPRKFVTAAMIESTNK
ncbi:uncharacterized protein DUF2533 [Aneurinibacillus soli]|uniref:Uncharacterized protein n=1 Tax=Aneurinibacillus soli TaxID=1500254 RepID=A0A0U5ATT1_9BACL|nr:DUF2533 family protein [Aneurinibacillus soli]PYE62591.1 uncharacterized protein DUF2533 [Aneurinibacillus soli]BAU27153.1 hypothetical protein CB4_01322 [Aneurinibacillus soli]